MSIHSQDGTFLGLGGTGSPLARASREEESFSIQSQDDFGGTIHNYEPTQEMIEFAQKSIKTLSPTPVYARVDIIWDNNNKMAVSELELIEPELWFRNNPSAATKIAKVLKEKVVI